MDRTAPSPQTEKGVVRTMSTKPSILVVDDSDDGREMLVEYLAFRHFPVVAARNGAEAIDVARCVQPTIILMDLSMPTMDGWEATRRLKRDDATKHAVIVVVTAHAFPTEQQAAREAGCDVIIAKPFDLAVLADALEHGMPKGLAALKRLALPERDGLSPEDTRRPPRRSRERPDETDRWRGGYQEAARKE